MVVVVFAKKKGVRGVVNIFLAESLPLVAAQRALYFVVLASHRKFCYGVLYGSCKHILTVVTFKRKVILTDQLKKIASRFFSLCVWGGGVPDDFLDYSRCKRRRGVVFESQPKKISCNPIFSQLNPVLTVI